MPIDHTSIVVPLSRWNDAVTFFKAALAPLGIKKVMDFPDFHSIGFGEELAYFWIMGAEAEGAAEETVLRLLKKNHIAFVAESEEQVQHFHQEAMKAGASDNGGPGQRPEFGPQYYAAFVHDPVLGINLEVVCRR